MTRRGTTTVTTTATNIDFQADGGSVLVEITGASSWDGTVDFQATPDGITFFNIPYIRRDQLDPARSVAQISSPSTAILYELLGPLAQVRIACGAGTTGTLTVVHRTLPAGAVSFGGVVQHPAASVDVSEGITADQEATVAAATGLRLVGYSARESAATPAAAGVGIMNGATVVGGSNIARVELAANESTIQWLWPGIDAADGLTIEVLAGTVDVYLYHATVV